MDGPAIFTIPPGIPFVDALAGGLLARAGGDPLALARMTVLLPTRRAGRALREAFLRLGDGRPLLLPRMAPIGDVDADELTLAPADEAEADGTLDLPPSLPELRRRLLLARLVLAWGAAAEGERLSPAQAASLAAELARLLDHLGTEGIEPARLATLAGDFARHWERTLDFLRIVIDRWPAILEESGALDPAVRRDRLIRAQAARWRAAPPADPVIAAGSTGSIPATAELLGVVARLPQGAVVLPGLDRDADPQLWPAIEADPSHPQHGMARLLTSFGIAAHAVPPWPWPTDAAASRRSRLVAEALRPSAATEVWTRPEWRHASGLATDLDAALAGARRIDCAGSHEEAGAIAILMREVLETPAKTAALVTPDRALARRVAAELRRWDIEVDDSAGTPLGETPPGSFLRLVADAFASELAPVPLLALLKHPLATFGMAPGRFRRAVRAIEVAGLRGVRPAPGFAALAAALSERKTALRALVERIDAATRPFADLVAARAVPLADLLRAHVRAAEALAATPEADGSAQLWRGEAGEAAARFVAGLDDAAAGFPPIAGADYAGLLATLSAGIAVRPAWGRHPRLHIWGPLEARLQQADRVILGGLNEGTWPAIAEADPWLSRPMRAALGLPPVERRIGLSAHDFAQAIAAREAFLTRAVKVDGTPTVPSRWLLRLDATLAALGRVDGMPRADAPRDLQQRLDDRVRDEGGFLAPRPARPIPPPAPRPPVAVRPRKLSVTEIETWLADPYAIYARHVLRLKALDPVDADLGAAERGIALHLALDRFLALVPPPAPLPPDALARLLDVARATLADHLDRPIVRAFWWPRFERIAHWFVAEETTRRATLAESWGERRGAWTFDAPAGPFTLTGRADRIDRIVGAGLEIIDYKTGTVPSPREVMEGRAPQLALEAAMIAAGAFPGVTQEPPARLAYWRLTGGEPPGEVKAVAEDAAKTAALMADAQDGLAALIARFDEAGTAYLARPRPEWAPRFSDYAHLARIAEWAAGGGEE